MTGTSKYDKLLPQLLEDLKTMSMSEVERNHNLRSAFLSVMIPKWKTRGLIDKGYVPPVKFRRETEPIVLPAITLPAVTTTVPKVNEPAKVTPFVAVAPKQPVRLPPFDNNWSNEVKIEWLKAYTAVVGRAKTIPFKEEEKS